MLMEVIMSPRIKKNCSFKLTLLIVILVAALSSFICPRVSSAACFSYAEDPACPWSFCDTAEEAVAAASACCTIKYSHYHCGCTVIIQYNADNRAVAALTYSPYWTGFECDPSRRMESMRAFGILNTCSDPTNPCCNSSDPCCGSTEPDCGLVGPYCSI